MTGLAAILEAELKAVEFLGLVYTFLTWRFADINRRRVSGGMQEPKR